MKRMVAALAMVAILAVGCSTEAPPVEAEVAATAETPQETPEPEPEPEPEPTVQERLEVFGTFDTVTFSGSADDVVTLPRAAGAIVAATYTGSSNFAIWTLGVENEELELLVNTIGAYEGETAYFDDAAASLKIAAEGPWTITVMPLNTATPMTDSNTGTGDAVLLYDTDAALWSFTHSGESNFVVRRLVPGELELLVNTIGAYEGSVPVTPGAGVVTINADGNWTFTAN